MANLAQFTGQSTANIIARDLGNYAWPLWISAVVSLFSFLCAISVFVLDTFLRSRYAVTDQTTGKFHTGAVKAGLFKLSTIGEFSMTFWIIVFFSVFENAGVQSFVSISTSVKNDCGYMIVAYV